MTDKNGYIYYMFNVKRTVCAIHQEQDREEKSSLSPVENIHFTWDLTEEIFSIAGNTDVKSRLQRHIINIIRP